MYSEQILFSTTKDSNDIRKLINDQKAIANIPSMPQRRIKPSFSKKLYKQRNLATKPGNETWQRNLATKPGNETWQRNLVERFFNKLKHFRAIATRYEKDPENYLAGVKRASTRIWIKFNESMT